MKISLLIVLVTLFFSGCEDPTKTDNKHTVINIQKGDLSVLDYTGLINQFEERQAIYYTEDYNSDELYMIFWFRKDISISINLDYKLSCGVSSHAGRYFEKLESGTSILNYGVYSVFAKKELDDHNCLQAGGQLEDLTGSLYGYAEYTQNRTTPTKHTVTSNSITYTAQEINEAFAVFGK